MKNPKLNNSFNDFHENTSEGIHLLKYKYSKKLNTLTRICCITKLQTPIPLYAKKTVTQTANKDDITVA